jgi:hypothetical protein
MLALVLGETPALPLHTAGKYVAAAYVVLFAIVLIYVAVMSIRLSHMERDLGELLTLSERTEQEPPTETAAAAQATDERESAPA